MGSFPQSIVIQSGPSFKPKSKKTSLQKFEWRESMFGGHINLYYIKYITVVLGVFFLSRGTASMSYSLSSDFGKKFWAHLFGNVVSERICPEWQQKSTR